MPKQIVITEKSSQARDVHATVGERYGPILAAEGHLRELDGVSGLAAGRGAG